MSPSKWDGFPSTPHTALTRCQRLSPRRRHFPPSNSIPPVSTACRRRRSSLTAPASIACRHRLRSPPRRTIPSQANTHKGAPRPLLPIAMEALSRETHVCATSRRSVATPPLTLAWARWRARPRRINLEPTWAGDISLIRPQDNAQMGAPEEMLQAFGGQRSAKHHVPWTL